MNDPIIILTVIVAFAAGYVIAAITRKRQNVDLAKVLKDYVPATQAAELRKTVEARQADVERLTGENAHQEAVITGLHGRLNEDKKRLEEQQERFKIEFENLANRILDEKTQSLGNANAQRLDAIIKPFNDKINEFGKKVEQTYLDSTRERSSLKEQIRHMMEAQSQLSDDALRLTQALKGDNQFQGSWGEIQLKRLLESSGLQEGVHFELQNSFKNEAGKTLRPDVIIKLPENKHLILDSKVSLVAFEEFMNADDEEIRQKALDAHLISIKSHIKGLSEKKYSKLNGINPPDYVLMFMPLEPAFIAAVQADPKLYEKAVERNIGIVSPSTLMATLRTIAHIWKNENQTRNVIEIAKEGAALYDKFVGFLEDMDALGRRLQGAQSEYTSAMNKLSTASRKGNTIIGKVERLRELGANPSKRIGTHHLSEVAVS